MTPEQQQVLARARERFNASEMSMEQQAVLNAARQRVQKSQELSLMDYVKGGLETAATFGSALAAEPTAGIAGLISTLYEDPKAGAETVGAVKEAMTYTPRSKGGQRMVQGAGEFLEPVAQGLEYISRGAGDVAYDVTGSPLAGALGYSAPAAVLELLGLKGIRAARNIPLKTASGEPTKQLHALLNKQGLNYESLTPQAQAMIPYELPTTGVIPSVRGDKIRTGKDIAAADIQAGGRQAGLAEKSVSERRFLPGTRLQADKTAQAAITQGFEPSLVQAVKTATPETQKGMLQQLKIMERVKSNQSVTQRPSIVTGQAVGKRVSLIRDKLTAARDELNRIAQQEFRGKLVNVQPVADELVSALDDLDINIVATKGKPSVDFVGSVIEKDRSAQRVIKDMIDLMAGGGAPDAYRLHRLKQQIDTMIDYRKKSQTGLTPKGEIVAKRIRRKLNDTLRELDPNYAEVNDTMSRGLTAINDFDDVTGSRINIFTADDVGQEMRKLFSNYGVRPEMERAIGQLDYVAAEFGGNFTDSARDLAMFALNLDKRFGAVATSSFQGQIEAANAAGRFATQAATGSPKAAAVGAGVDIGKRAWDKIRGVNEYNAYRSMEELLKKGNR